MQKRLFIGLVFGVLMMHAGMVCAEEQVPSKGLRWFYRMAYRLDNFLLQGVDTNYITLPEHSWRLAYTTSMVGINSMLDLRDVHDIGTITFASRTTPSVDLGFNAGYRSFGVSYSWDVLHAYSQKLSLSLGSKRFGLEFDRATSTDIRGYLTLHNYPNIPTMDMKPGYMWITNTRLSVWYALNAAHYSHQAAIKQSYIQRKTAGSLLLSLTYLSTDLSLHDSVTLKGKPVFVMLMDDVSRMVTHQVAIGIGYGINYTPNKGKVILHLSANAELVCYSIDQISFALPDTLELPGMPQYTIKPKYPVHVTGNIRAAVSWEINKWVHLSAYGQANNIRFTAREDELSKLHMDNWNWQARITIGVRFGAGRDRVQRSLDYDRQNGVLTPIEPVVPRKSRLPKWVTDYFYSPLI